MTIWLEYHNSTLLFLRKFGEMSLLPNGQLDITDPNKRINELGEEVGAKFEREGRFQELTRCRSEMEKAQDMTKNQAPVQVAATSDELNAEENSQMIVQAKSHRRTQTEAVRV